MLDRLKVLFLSHEYPPFPTGGIGSYTASMARAMAARGHVVHVLSCIQGQPRTDRQDGPVFVHRRDWSSAPPRLQRRGGQSARALATAIACRNESKMLGVDFDIIESPDYLAEGLALLRGPTPVVAYAHVPERMDRRRAVCDVLERKVLHDGALVRCPSRILADHLLQRRWVKPSRMAVMDPPIELDVWKPTDMSSPSPLVLMVGRLDAVKSPETLLLAAVALRKRVPGMRLRFVGKSVGRRSGRPYGEWLQALAGTLGVPCEFIPDLPREELPAHYASATVIVVPSAVDNLPMVALEAMACGRAVIGTDRSGLAEMIPGTGAGTIVPAGNPPALMEALVPFVTDPQVAATAGRRARGLVEDRCDPDLVAGRVEVLYERIAGRRSDRRTPAA